MQIGIGFILGNRKTLGLHLLLHAGGPTQMTTNFLELKVKVYSVSLFPA
jgi:hypothetical protein